MDIGAILLGAAGGGIVTIAGNALKFWRSGAATDVSITKLAEMTALRFAEIERQFDSIEKHRAESAASQNNATGEMRMAAIQIARLSESQSIINAMTAKTLEALTIKVEDHSRRIENNAQVVAFIRENCKGCPHANG